MKYHARYLILLAGAVACSSGGGDTTAPPTTGSLTVTITVPAGVTANVSVTGPGNFAQTLNATTTIGALVPGSYTVRADAAAGADPIVGIPYSGAVTGSPATVVANATADASVTYTQRATAGYLWVANIGADKISGFTSAQLAASGTPVPAVSLSIKGSKIAVDASGGMWVSSYQRDTLYYFTQAQLLAGGSPLPTRRIGTKSGSLSQPTGLAFDAQGDLWVANRANNTLVEYTPSQLAATGAPVPTSTVTSVFNFMATPWGIGFDAHGTLWVASFADSVVVGYSAAQLATGGAITPIGGISNTAGHGTFGVAFDAAGNLWVAAILGQISKFTPDQLTSLGAPVPSVVISGSGLLGPVAFAFDASGSLWVADELGAQLVKYTTSQLAAGGSPVPAVIIHNTGGSVQQPTDLAFSPHAAALPIH
jgi:ligand-binding sensor domain-containing protein